MDELIDAGKILEIDPSAIANRVLMRGADARQPLASELTVQQVKYYHCLPSVGRQQRNIEV